MGFTGGLNARELIFWGEHTSARFIRLGRRLGSFSRLVGAQLTDSSSSLGREQLCWEIRHFNASDMCSWWEMLGIQNETVREGEDNWWKGWGWSWYIGLITGWALLRNRRKGQVNVHGTTDFVFLMCWTKQQCYNFSADRSSVISELVGSI